MADGSSAGGTAVPLLEVANLTKRYGGLVAVKDLSFSIRPGEILGLIGPNGSGKSTAMKSVMGVERPTAGSIRIDGAEIAGLPSHKVARRGVGLVFQHSRPLARQTVLENIKVALLPDKLTQLFAGADVEAQARAIAERVGLAAVVDRRPPTLAFADLRRLELAKAIARHPKVVLVDEPFAGLTASEVAAFSELIREFRAEGRAVLLVDHNVKGVSALVDRVLAMYLGERIAEGAAADVMNDETVRRVYLGGALTRVEHPATAAAGTPAGAEGRGRRRAVRQGARARSRVAACRARASSCRSSDSTAPARRRCSTPSPGSCRIRASCAGAATR